MRRLARTKIVATVGPGSDGEECLGQLFEAGVDVFRFNFSHGGHEDHARRFQRVRAVEKRFGRPIGILADLQGPKLRVGTFANGRVLLKAGQAFRFDLDATAGDERRAPLPHPEIFQALKPGSILLLDDGKLRMEVTACGTDHAITEVVVGGPLSDHKGVNLPNVPLKISPLTPKDRDDLAFALELGISLIGLSFVQRPDDILEARELVGDRAKLLAKLEKPSAIQHLEAIVSLVDAVMVARGDLGVEMPPEDVPVLQRRIVRACRSAGKPVIVATQMLESMIASPTPTRAEASDVANAVYEGADAVMLSAETAVGRYPLEAVTIMEKIILRTERDPAFQAMLHAHPLVNEASDGAAVAVAARDMAEALSAQAIVTLTTSGDTTGRVSRERPSPPILALSNNEVVARNLALNWGVHAVMVEELDTFRKMNELAETVVTREQLAEPGDTIVIVGGFPVGASVNTVRIGKAR